MALHHIDAQPGIALNAVVRFDLSDHAVHPVQNGGEVDVRLLSGQPQAVGLVHLMGKLGAADQRLGGDAALVQAIAAHVVGLDQRDLGLCRGGDIGRD